MSKMGELFLLQQEAKDRAFGEWLMGDEETQGNYMTWPLDELVAEHNLLAGLRQDAWTRRELATLRAAIRAARGE